MVEEAGDREGGMCKGVKQLQKNIRGDGHIKSRNNDCKGLRIQVKFVKESP